MRPPTPYFTDNEGVELYLGDCREILPALGITAELVCTDPPYSETSLKWDRWPDGWRTGDRVLVTRTNSATAKNNPSLTQQFVGTITLLAGEGELDGAFNLHGHQVGGRDVNRIFSSNATLQRCYGCTQTIEPAPEN